MALPAPTACLAVEAISVTPPGMQTLVVRDAAFRLEAGQALGVIGPRGSGKSSLARALVMLIAGFGGWAVTTELAGAVIGSGFLVVDSNVKKVQHPTGGVVGELRVRDGDQGGANAKCGTSS